MSSRTQQGFTLVELVVAMSVFSFMLLIITVGFMNIVRIHNAALAANMAQDNARTAIDEMVRGVRDSAGVAGTPAVAPNGTLCLNYTTGPQLYYYIKTVSGVRTLYRRDGCTAPGSNDRAVTNGYVNVQSFEAKIETSGPNIVKPKISVSVTVGSSNGTTTGIGSATKCLNTYQDRAFCSVVTLTSGATPR